MIKICKICGKEFESKNRKSVCGRKHYNVCINCGKSFEVDANTYENKLCSRECRVEYNSKCRRGKSNSVTNKTSRGKYTRICVLCGESFRTNSESRTTCYKDHEVKCPICGKTYIVGHDGYYKSTCSYSCAAEFRARQLESSEGIRSTLQRPDVIDKCKVRNIERYGVENPLSSLEIREKIKETCLERYGVEFATQSESMKEKSRETCLERYGAEYYTQTSEFRDQSTATNIRKFGAPTIFQSKEFQESMKRRNQELYGVDYYASSDDFKYKQQAAFKEKYDGNTWSDPTVRAKCNETNLVKYGHIWPQCTEEVRQKQLESFIANRAAQIQDEDARRNYLDFKQDPQKYLRDHSDLCMSMCDIADTLGYADATLLYDFIHKNNMDDILRWSGMSKMEQDIVNFISAVAPNTEIKIHDRTAIHPKELDIYLPEYRIGFECNPTITHNSTYVLGNALGASEYKVTPRDYHLRKTEMCESQGIFLFHIFGYEWKNCRPVILSMIKNILGKNTAKYYARKLDLREVSSKDAIEFLNANHRQGYANSSVRLGLYNKNELVSLMTFGPMRTSLGRKKAEASDTVELIRFCNKVNSSVVGGASKLFKYYLHHFCPSKVVSFSDRAHTKGNLYKTLGFSEVNSSEPGYVWVNLSTNLYLSRLACQKQNLPKLFDEPDLDIENQTEQQIMSKHGFVQVFDSGTIRWEYET